MDGHFFVTILVLVMFSWICAIAAHILFPILRDRLIDRKKNKENENEGVDETKPKFPEGRTTEPYSGTIFCLMGKSASGKDTVYARLCEKISSGELPLAKIVTYTTRPMRDGEKDGGEYFFLDEAALDARQAAGDVIERRSYNTEYGKWSYATLDDGQIEGDKCYLVIGTPEAYGSLVSYFGQKHVVPMLITIDDGTRLMRALTREMQQEKPKYDEMCRRYLSDKRDFDHIDSDESVAKFVNREVAQCASEISNYILEHQDKAKNEN